tara:strand:+ start:194 stop:388 length:195 start_codon:yes stop_codon:yes gene_type:complete
MSKMKNWIMDIEDFCNGYICDNGKLDPVWDFSVEEISEDVGMYFHSNEAKEYAKGYLTKTLGEI